MSLLKIKKFTKKLMKEEVPNQIWSQVDTNPTSIASLLITIDSLQKGESITITKL